jgi:3-deoxy-D-manno-octulosonic-acid transferase
MPGRLIYSALWLLALPAVILRLWWKGRRQPGYRQHLAERFGRYTFQLSPGSIWLHAVSVGETRAAQPLIRALRIAHPGRDILLTHMTPTGRETSAALYTGSDPHIHAVYLPYDLPWLQRRFLRHFDPAIGVLMETEVWPNLAAACSASGVALMLVNGRLSARSFGRYRRLASIARAAFGSFAAVAAQAEADAARFRALGAAKVVVTGNIKFDNHPDPALVARGETFRQAAGVRQIVLAASTRDGEEGELLDAAASLLDSAVLLVIVPRHPQRFDEVAQLAISRGYRVGRRSRAEGPSEDDQVWIGDSMGEMSAYFAMADLTLMGGTWRPFGGQNFIECCAVGTPVLLGPSTFNFAEASALALEAGAALGCADLTDAVGQARRLLGDPATLSRMSAAGRAFAQAHGGATERTLALVSAVIDNAALAQHGNPNEQ